MADQENGIALAAMPRVSADISDFAAAWRGWRGGNVVPVRDQLNLDDIQKLLSRVLVMEVWSPRPSSAWRARRIWNYSVSI